MTPDPRTVRTRELLIKSFVVLCGERGTQRIAVSDIARRAGVNRATFYRHFEDRVDLMNRGIETLLRSMFERAELVAPVGSAEKDGILARVVRFFEIAEEHGKTLRLLTSGAAGSVLQEKTREFVEGFLWERRLMLVGDDALALPPSIAVRVLTGIFWSFVSWWIDHPRTYSAAEMGSLCLHTGTKAVFKDA